MNMNKEKMISEPSSRRAYESNSDFKVRFDTGSIASSPWVDDFCLFDAPNSRLFILKSPDPRR